MTAFDYAPGVDPTELRTLWSLSFEKTTRGIAIIEARSRHVVAVNPAFAEMHGGEVHEFVGKTIDDSLTPEGAARLPELAERLDASGFVSLESDHVRRDGTVFRVSSEVMAALDDEGELLYRICWFTDLTEQRQLERRRREAERQFEAAFSKAAIGMGLVAIDGRWLRANPALCELTGYTEGELRGLSFTEITHPDDLEANLEGDERLLRGEASDYKLEKRYIRKDGESVWVLLSVSLDRDEDGEPTHYIVQVHDISLRKRIEADLAHATSGVDLDRDLICTVGPDARIKRLEGRWREVLGWSEEELVARPLVEFVHPDDRADTLVELARVHGRGEPASFQHRWQTKDGHWSWLHWSVPGSDGSGHFFCSVREVNDRLAIETAFELRGEVIANMTEGVCLMTKDDGRIVYANPSLERMLGYGPGELNGRDAIEVMRPVDLSEEERATRDAAVSDLYSGGEMKYEARRLRKDGSEIWVRTTATTFDHPSYGKVWVGVQQDITEERQARLAAAELERAKSEFLGSISHELRTPLTSILGYATLLRADAGGPPGPQFDHIEVIERNATRQLRLVEDLLNIARISAGEFELRRQPLDLAQLVHDEVEALQPDATAAGLTLDVSTNGPLAVMGDADRLTQVVANLVSNSIKFTPAGGQIKVGLRVANREALVRVEDSGPGFDADELPHLFERLYRGIDVRDRQISGAGLGLAISRSIVEAHSGRIEARDSELGGACFEVALPAL
ncbi:MAG TPA: PAS domain S-box protein [Solirubrobacterales bacterium]|nr:PAS domain S-box protein [Solirubrobacterales bacterium]